MAAFGHDGRWGLLEAEVLDLGRVAAGDADLDGAPLPGGALDQRQGLVGPGRVGEADEAEGPAFGDGLLEGRHQRRRGPLLGPDGEELRREVRLHLGSGEGGGVSGELGQHPAQLPANGTRGEEGRGAGHDPVGVDLLAVAGQVVPGGGVAGGRRAGGDGGRQQGPGQQENHELASEHPDHLQRLVAACGLPGMRLQTVVSRLAAVGGAGRSLGASALWRPSGTSAQRLVNAGPPPTAGAATSVVAGTLPAGRTAITMPVTAAQSRTNSEAK
jgi:hypothetical protein